MSTRATPSPEQVLHDIEMDRYYRTCVRKAWHRPRFYRYRVGDPARFRPVLNRYPHHVIGAGVVIGRWCYAVKWAGLGRRAR